MLVGNNWAGTVTVLDPETFQRLALVDAVPDWDDRVAEIKRDLGRRAAFNLIRRFAGEGHNQLVDDVFPSRDGRYLYASRPSFADVVAIDVSTGQIKWRTPVQGTRADHAALSPNGKTLLVSATTAGLVHAIDTESGQIVGGFKSGDEPHESNYSPDGSTIYHASIGRVFLPTQDALQGERVFLIVNAETLQELDRIDMGQKSKEAGDEWKDSAVRPMAIAPDGKSIFFQMSFYHGFFEFDLEKKAIVDRTPLPAREPNLPRRKYQLNSAHHGITISGDGQKLCVAGTVSGYAAIVDRTNRKRYTVIPIGEKPYWATTSADGRYCYVSVSETDELAVISFADEKKLRAVPVGDHPQRVRTGRLRIGPVDK